MRREDRKVVALLGFLHGVVHANILAIPVFLNFAWRDDFHADSLTLGLLFALGFGLYGVGAVPFGFLADRRSPGPLLLLPAIAVASLLLARPLPHDAAGDRGDPVASRRALFTVPFLLVLLVYMFAGFAYQGGLAFLPHFIGPGLFVLALACGAMGQVASGRLADRPRPERTLFALSLVGALLLLLLALFVSSSLSGAPFGGAAIVFGLVLL